MKITFKNVGQGDSIILECKDKDLLKICIVDCKTYNNENPVLQHVILNKYKSIDLLILSHPHLDHFSGFTELINYCIDNSIQIKYFLHTCNNMPAYWKAATTNNEASNEAIKLFQAIRKANDKIGMYFSQIQAETPTSEIILGTNYKLKILAPTSKAFDYYAKNHVIQPIEEETGNNPSANWLSTIIKIHCDDWFILLTSDVEESILAYYLTKKNEDIQGRLVLAQSPHHGSFNNHKNSFWKKLTKEKNTPIIFSVGKNQYNHPSEKVVSSFRENGYEIFSTNEVGGLNITPLTKIATETSNILDVFGEFVSKQINNKLNGDKVFQVDKTGKVTIL